MDIINTFLDILLGAGYFQGVLLILFLFFKSRGNRKANRVLGILVICFLSSMTHFFYNFHFNTYFPVVNKIGEPFQFLFGPLLYFYVRILTDPQYEINLFRSMAFFAFGISCIFIYFLSAVGENLPTYVYSALTITLWAIILIHNAMYLIAIHLYLKKYPEQMKNNFSNLEKINLAWINIFLLGIALVYAVYFTLVPLVLHIPGMSLLLNKIAITFLALMIILISYRGLLQPEIFHGLPLGNSVAISKLNSDKFSVKYEKNNLNSYEISFGLKQIQKLLESKKLYLDKDFSLQDLSQITQFSVNKISQIINLGAGCNFYDFINQYRLKQVLSYFAEPDKRKNYTILALAYDAGFNSKSTFNKFFKKSQGMTPSQYIAEFNKQ